MKLSPIQQRYLWTEQVLGAALFNLLINALIGWLSFRKSARVAVWGDPSLALDLSATAFVLPFLVCLITTPLVVRAVQSGKVSALDSAAREHAWLRWLPQNLWLRSLTIALLSVLLTVPELVLVLRGLELQHVSLLALVVCKALWSAGLAALVAPLAALYVLATESATALRAA